MSTLQNTPRKSALRVAMEERNRAAIVDAFEADAVFHSPLCKSSPLEVASRLPL